MKQTYAAASKRLRAETIQGIKTGTFCTLLTNRRKKIIKIYGIFEGFFVSFHKYFCRIFELIRTFLFSCDNFSVKLGDLWIADMTS